MRAEYSGSRLRRQLGTPIGSTPSGSEKSTRTTASWGTRSHWTAIGEGSASPRKSTTESCRADAACHGSEFRTLPHRLQAPESWFKLTVGLGLLRWTICKWRPDRRASSKACGKSARVSSWRRLGQPRAYEPCGSAPTTPSMLLQGRTMWPPSTTKMRMTASSRTISVTRATLFPRFQHGTLCKASMTSRRKRRWSSLPQMRLRGPRDALPPGDHDEGLSPKKILSILV